MDLLVTVQYLDWLGSAAFAVSGAIAAARRRFDVMGFVVVGAITGIGGGTLRDLLIGRLPVAWMVHPSSLYVSLVCPFAVFVLLRMRGHAIETVPGLRWADAVGLAVFSVLGCSAALERGIDPFIAAIMGALTAAGGGVIRDLLCGTVPIVFRREVYILAALTGGGLYAMLRNLGLADPLAVPCALAVGFVLRAIAMVKGWSVPGWRERNR
ncbi:trimeric intracellular cation channel family protein [Shumkonia mesophila]|uniref:trimeric intracellular cation channel family protein n=1 Tax=Shumkonia mesophila TaxID=2838854 RepID=UPI0029341B16|nr:trimeric intracellular cation channel family protein [Shumkonia mesophila]